eukprot:TRINITY_DN66349_c5_g14_i1.p3 TRINITY_DN66349_c5_g14~~TRINITY_DN66349_c5_g14_i1.p3  ORF type:complete len:142 (-),score=74.75 TRINITY_DN66349_c5_g14_i1:142-567(-)
MRSEYLADRDDVGFVVVAPEKFGWEEFSEGKFDGSVDVYADEARNVYKHFKTNKGGYLMLAMPSVIKAKWNADKKGFTGNLKGDGWQLGGTWVLDKEGQEQFAFTQDYFGDRPDYNLILLTLGVKEPRFDPSKVKAPEKKK